MRSPASLLRVSLEYEYLITLDFRELNAPYKPQASACKGRHNPKLFTKPQTHLPVMFLIPSPHPALFSGPSTDPSKLIFTSPWPGFFQLLFAQLVVFSTSCCVLAFAKAAFIWIICDFIHCILAWRVWLEPEKIASFLHFQIYQSVTANTVFSFSGLCALPLLAIPRSSYLRKDRLLLFLWNWGRSVLQTSLAAEHWRSAWSISSVPCLQIEHVSQGARSLSILRLFVIILSCRASHTNTLTRLGTFNFQIAFHSAASAALGCCVARLYANRIEKDPVVPFFHQLRSAESGSSSIINAVNSSRVDAGSSCCNRFQFYSCSLL